MSRVVHVLLSRYEWSRGDVEPGLGAAYDRPTSTAGFLSEALTTVPTAGTRARAATRPAARTPARAATRAAAVAGAIPADGAAPVAAKALLDAVVRGGPPGSG
ncbi:hypothetical protein [Embleya sp. AB8]|uniref:hypothetical protein n=1 Tax=Embleya sp. AB8 TaxID=3156304 RepID=UPI003C712D4A